jgi:hypothetical protein
MRRTVGIAAGIVAAASIIVFAASCVVSTGPNARTYIANLSPANEVPQKATTGTGVVTFVDNGAAGIDWSMDLTNMTNVIASHIHGPAPAGVNANIIFNLYLPIRPPETGTLTGFVGSGTLTNASNPSVSLDSLRVLFNNGMAYVNVHTTANPGGEIRDQIHPQ